MKNYFWVMLIACTILGGCARGHVQTVFVESLKLPDSNGKPVTKEKVLR